MCVDGDEVPSLDEASSLGASDNLPSLKSKQLVFPHCGKDNDLESLPFAKETFKTIIDSFNLPPTTPWAFGSGEPHFEPHFQLHWGYNNDDDDEDDSGAPSLVGM